MSIIIKVKLPSHIKLAKTFAYKYSWYLEDKFGNPFQFVSSI